MKLSTKSIILISVLIKIQEAALIQKVIFCEFEDPSLNCILKAHKKIKNVNFNKSLIYQ